MEVVRSRQGAGLCGNCRRRLPQQRNARVAAGPPSSGDLDPDELEEQRQSLERLAMRRTNDSITGPELRQLVEQQFGKPFDTRLTQKRDYFNGLRMYLQVMWKYLGQKSFPLTEEQYNEQLQAVAELVTEWGVVQQVREGIKSHKKAPGISTVGARAVEVKLNVGHPEM